MSATGDSKTDNLLKHAAILFSGMAVVHVCNILFQMAVSRAVPDSEYVLLAAFLSVLAMIQRPLGTLRTGVSHYGSILQQENRTGDLKRLLRKWLVLTGVPSLLLGCTVLLFYKNIAGYFHLNRAAPIVILGITLPVLFILPVLGGAVQGLQKFKWNAAANISNAAVRLGLGAGFVWFLYPACGWALLGHGLGLYVGSGVLLIGLLISLRGAAKSSLPLPSMRFYLLQSFFIQAAYVVLMTADVVLVKHYQPDDTEFAFAATLGRMVVFLPGAIVAAMFPKVASRGTMTEGQKAVFIHSFVYTAAAVILAVAGCFIFAGLLARILFGITDASQELKLMIGLMALVMGFSALLNVVVQFLVAQRRFFSAFSVIGFALLYLAGSVFFHESAWQIVLISGACNAGAFLCCFVMLFKSAGSDKLISGE